MSIVTDLRSWRPDARKERFSTENRTESKGNTAVALQTPAAPVPAWDPYEVWRTRVKEPRDRSERSRDE